MYENAVECCMRMLLSAVCEAHTVDMTTLHHSWLNCCEKHSAGPRFASLRTVCSQAEVHICLQRLPVTIVCYMLPRSVSG